MRASLVAVLSFVFTYLFFLEYLPPVRARVRLPFDMPVFHYPFADYAFQALRHGRFPEWDPTIYAGMPFAANVQAALFYPGTWLAFFSSAGRDHLSYQALEDLVLLHVWLAFLLCFLWLARNVSPFAAACGAGIYAYGGYLLLQLQHLGVVIGFAWIPLGLWGIDEFVERREWRGLWKAAAASACAFLGGYTPTWAVAVACLLGYALFRRKGATIAFATGAALCVSMLLCAVQLLPAMQLSALREAEVRYSGDLRDPWFYLSYLVPNYYDFAFSTDVRTNAGREYLYLGAPGLLGLALVIFLRRRKDSPQLADTIHVDASTQRAGATQEEDWSAAPFAALLAAVAVVVANPFDSVWSVIRHSTLLAQVIRDYYFLAGFSVAAAPLAAIGIDRFLNRRASSPRRPWRVWSSGWTSYTMCLLLAAWSARLLYQWGRDALPIGWASAADAAVMLILFALGLLVLRSQTGRPRAILAAALLLAVGVDYKAHGTRKRFNGTTQDPSYRSGGFLYLDAAVYRQLRENNVYRVAVEPTSPFPQTLRHFGLTTPQGFDPFLTSAYKKLAESLGTFRSNWEFDLSPSRTDALDTLGVRFFLTTEQGSSYRDLSASSQFRLLAPATSYFKAFERIEPKTPYGWALGGAAAGIEPGTNSGIQRIRWEPERREFEVRTETGGTLYQAEQWHPGWSARIDGVAAPVERWPGDSGREEGRPEEGGRVEGGKAAFQSVTVPAGEHRVAFRYAEPRLRVGAGISAITLLGVVLALRRKRAS